VIRRRVKKNENEHRAKSPTPTDQVAEAHSPDAGPRPRTAPRSSHQPPKPASQSRDQPRKPVKKARKVEAARILELPPKPAPPTAAVQPEPLVQPGRRG